MIGGECDCWAPPILGYVSAGMPRIPGIVVPGLVRLAYFAYFLSCLASYFY